MQNDTGVEAPDPAPQGRSRTPAGARPTHPLAHRIGRTPVLFIRRASGMGLTERLRLQTERDELVAELGALDEELLERARRRRTLIDELGALREDLYPIVPWCHGRRPPDLDRAPLPPAAADAEVLVGRWLRAACLAILRRHGATSLRELHALLHLYGYVVGSQRPVTALSDAMAYETERGRARRVARGVYEAIDRWQRRRGGHLPDAPLPSEPSPWASLGPSALDPGIYFDPETWIRQRAERLGSGPPEPP